jgi:hypothetical protein
MPVVVSTRRLAQEQVEGQGEREQPTARFVKG